MNPNLEKMAKAYLNYLNNIVETDVLHASLEDIKFFVFIY